MKVVILKYNAGNIMSVDNALRRMGIEAELTNEPAKVTSADKVIFPGVGEASTAMRYLREHKLDQLIKDLKQPFLGICIGLQLMCAHSEEGDVDCIGIFNEKVKLFDNKGKRGFKVPQMGWNTITNLETKLFEGGLENEYVYFVHSYYAETGLNTIARTTYLNEFSSGLHKDNYYATQFHPEKSGKIGARVLQNFIEL